MTSFQQGRILTHQESTRPGADPTLTNAEIHNRTVALVSCTADAAIETLKQRSQRENRKLRDIAAEIVNDAIHDTDEV
jgi:hypothetical protein